MKAISKCFATIFWLGTLPRFQASITSFIAVLIFVFIKQLNHPILIYTLISIILFFFTYIYCKSFILKDKREIVSDEFCAAALIPFLVPNSIVLFMLTLLLYRFLDVKKPFFIKTIDKWNNFLAIFVDDYVAVAVAIVIINVLVYLCQYSQKIIQFSF